MSTIKPSKEVEKIIKLFEGEVEFEDEVIQHLNEKKYTLFTFLKVCGEASNGNEEKKAADFKAMGFLDGQVKAFVDFNWTSEHEKMLSQLEVGASLENKIKAIFAKQQGAISSDSPNSKLIKSYLQEAAFITDVDEKKNENEYLIRESDTPSPFPTIIYKRPCYSQLLNEIDEKLELNLTKPDVESVLDPKIARAHQILVSGSPGIGKTFFGYMLIKILYDNKVPFVYHTSDFKVLVADDQVVQINSELPERFATEKAIVYVVDSQLPDMNISYAYASSIVYIFHPNRKNRDAFTNTKQSEIHQYFLHLWNDDESRLPQLLEHAGLDRDTVDERLDQAGGIARALFADKEWYDRYWSEIKMLARQPEALFGGGNDEFDIKEPYDKIWHIISFDLEVYKIRPGTHTMSELVMGRFSMRDMALMLKLTEPR